MPNTQGRDRSGRHASQVTVFRTTYAFIGGKVARRLPSESLNVLNPLPLTYSTIYHPPAVFTRSPLLSHISSIFDMSQPSPLSSNFHILFVAALQDYKDKTGNTLADHPIAKQLESCESVNSITFILQEQARSFREFRENNGRLMKALDSSVVVLCAPSISSVLNEAIGLVVRRNAFIGVPCS